MNQNLLTMYVRHENSYGNYWHEDDICKCGTSIHSCDNEYPYNARGQHIIWCKDCYSRKLKERNDKKNPRHNAISKKAYEIAGNSSIFYSKTRNERIELRRVARVNLLAESVVTDTRKETEAEAWLRTIFPPQPYKESIVFKRYRAGKPVKDLKETYNHTCQVEGCSETEVEIAHIRKHSLHDSVDNETNMWCLCCNHHSAFDRHRMIVEDDSSFVRYNQDGTVREHGFIIRHDQHKVNVEFIRKSREYHVRKKQEMD